MKPLPIDSLMRIASPRLMQLPHGHKATRIFVYRDPRRSGIVGFNYEDDKNENRRGHVFIHPYSGVILGARTGNPHHEIWNTLAELHYQLLLGEAGSFLVKWSTFIMLIMVISGIVLWWPRNKAAAKQRFKFRWKITTRWKRKNYDLHNILGFYSSWIVIFMIITGSMWSFDWFNNGVYFLTSGGKSIQEPAAETDGFDEALDYRQYTEAFYAFKEKYAEQYASADEIAVGYFASESDKNIDVSASFDPKGFRVMKAIWANYDRTTHQMKNSNLDEIRNFGDGLQQSTNELHYGTYFGLPSKVATFFACLIFASLPVTGFYIWYGRKHRASRQASSFKLVKDRIDM